MTTTPAETCCCIPDDQQAAAKSGQTYQRCPRLAEWEIVEVTPPGLPTYACTEHVGALLSDAELFYITPYNATPKEKK